MECHAADLADVPEDKSEEVGQQSTASGSITSDRGNNYMGHLGSQRAPSIAIVPARFMGAYNERGSPVAQNEWGSRVKRLGITVRLCGRAKHLNRCKSWKAEEGLLF